jgi:hypothetical protein
LGLIPVLYSSNLVSKEILPEDVPLLAEYYKDDKLRWFIGDKTFVSLIFIREEDMTEELQDLLDDLKQYRMSIGEELKDPRRINVRKVRQEPEKECCCNPKIDVSSTLISILSSYPCYFAIVGKWVKDDSISLNIRFRANSILLSDENKK